MRFIVLKLIRLYQRFLSPLKGYSCAYRVYTGKESCSAYGYQAIERYGVMTGYQLIRRRMYKCTHVFELNHNHHSTRSSISRFQSGYCDGGCDGDCDASDCSGACDTLSGCAPVESCDLSSNKKESKPLKYKPLPKKI